MSPVQTAKKKPGKQKRKSGWLAWWPLLAGILVTPLAVRTAEILPLMGPDGLARLKLLYPYALLLRQHQLGLSEAAGEQVFRALLYAQFPLYGLFAALALRFRSFWSVCLQVLAIHFAGFLLLWALMR